MRHQTYLFSLLIICLLISSCKQPQTNNETKPTFTIDGNHECWNTITINFEGPNVTEHDIINPFLDYRLDVTFTNGKNIVKVPGFFAADGKAAETEATSGNIWKVRFSPNKSGTWNFKASFREGTAIAVNDTLETGTPIAFDGTSGSFDIKPTNSKAPGFLRKGRLTYTGKNYLQFAESKDYFLKGGADSPENFLAYHEFDNTPPKHKYAQHIKDWQEGDPVWQGDKGKGIIGALNYLSSKNMNVVYFLTNNVMGDGDDTYMWTSRNERYRFDCSKLDQWEIVFEHFDKLGIMMHIVTQENENQLLLDSGFTDVQRKLYYRELVARFSHHLGITWNMGEENGPIDWYHNLGQSNEQRITMAEYLRKTDPYKNLLVFHTFSYDPPLKKFTTPLLGNKSIDGVSLQIDHITNIHDEVKYWIRKSKDSLQPWVVNLDEIGHWKTGVLPDKVDIKHDSIRKYALWGSYMAGAAGTEWYMGIEDLTVEDFRTRETMWDQTRFALDFFHTIPFTEMENKDELILTGDTWCFAKENEIYVLYMLKGAVSAIDLSKTKGNYSLTWFNPRSGKSTKSSNPINAGQRIKIGPPPSEVNQDWVVLLKKSSNP